MARNAEQIPLPRRFKFDQLLVKEHPMLGTILVILIILALIGALPRWGYSSSWGYAPTGVLGVVLLVVLVLVLMGRI